MVNRKPKAGFTLVEIVVAVVLLGIGLSTLIGMQVNYANAYIEEENRTKATLYAQYIMALIETDLDPPDTGSDGGDLENHLRDLDYFNEDFEVGEEVPLDGWKYKMDVQSIDILELQDALRRIELTVNWGPTEREEYKVIFYMKNNPSSSSIGG